MSVNNESKPSATPPLPHTMLLLDGTFCSTLNGGGGGLEFYTNHQVILFSTIVSTLLSKIVASQSCAVAKSEKFCWAARQLILEDRMEDFH